MSPDVTSMVTHFSRCPRVRGHGCVVSGMTDTYHVTITPSAMITVSVPVRDSKHVSCFMKPCSLNIQGMPRLCVIKCCNLIVFGHLSRDSFGDERSPFGAIPLTTIWI